MSLAEAQLQFAAEFVTLVVAASALALVLLRPQQRLGRLDSGLAPMSGRRLALVIVSGVALVAYGSAAFAHGSLLVAGSSLQWVGLGRVVAATVLLVAFPYPGGAATGRTPIGGLLLRLGFACWLAAGATELSSAVPYATDGLLVAGSLLVAAALLRVARRSIAVRVAASGAVTLLLVVVVLSTALSAVISSSVQREELNRLVVRGATEKAALQDAVSSVAQTASLIEGSLSVSFSALPQDPLVAFAAGDPTGRAAAAISQRLSGLQSSDPQDSVFYTNPAGTSTVLADVSQPVSSPGFAGGRLTAASCQAGRSGLYVAGPQLTAGASSPACTTDLRPLGLVQVTRTFDSRYLTDRQAIDPSVDLALVSSTDVLATAGMPAAQALRLAGRLGSPGGQSVSQALGDQFAGVVAVGALDGTRAVPVWIVLTARSTTVLSSRDQLFRTLFLIAFGGTVLALGLAIFTGDRITAGLRRLTRAATGIQSGDTSVRAGVTGDDEVAAMGTAFDSMLDSVSAQAAALQAAAEDEARLRNRLEAVVAGMTDALVAVDGYGRITDFNRAAAELTGVDGPAAVGVPAEQVIRLRTDDGAPVGRRIFSAGARDAAMIGYLVRADADIPVAVSTGALRGPAGEQVGTVLVFRDLRREHEVEQMKTEFLSRVGHELRTPLTGIMGYADILLRRDVPAARARDWYEEILQSARRLLRIVEMLEFFASEGAGRMVLRPEPLDVKALVNGITSSWSGRLRGNLSIGRRVARAEAMVSADRRWLSLAVDELIDNAVKFSPEGGRILVRVTPSPDTVEIAVTDHGMGMTAEQYDVIFGDFVQGDNSDTRRFGGLGLGLAVVRRVAEGHGGTITCRSTPGKGTTFVISLPSWPQGGLPAATGAATDGTDLTGGPDLVDGE